MQTPDAQSVRDVVDSADSSLEPISELNMMARLEVAVRSSGGFAALSFEDRAEFLAILCREVPTTEREPSRGDYFAPHEIEAITPEVLAHWTRRAGEARDPVLIARYADLVWDLSKAASGPRPDVTLARTAIDAYARVALEKRHKLKGAVKLKLGRALGLALSIRDAPRVQNLKRAIIGFSMTDSPLDPAKYPGAAFDILLLGHSRVTLSAEEERQILEDEEARLRSLESPDDLVVPDCHAVTVVAMRLARYFRRKGRFNDLRRVLRSYRDIHVIAATRATGIVASSLLQGVYRTLYEFGMTDEARELERHLRDTGRRAVGEMHTFTLRTSVCTATLAALVDRTVEGDVAAVLPRIADEFVPDLDEMRNRIREAHSASALLGLMDHVIVDDDGTPVDTLGSTESDLDGRVAHEIAEELHHQALFLSRVLSALKDRRGVSAEAVLAFLAQSSLFDEKAYLILASGISAYFREDHIAALHLLVPQVERAIRALATECEASVSTPKKSDPQARLYRPLGTLLADERLTRRLGEAHTRYLRVLLTEPGGWNLRNLLCHGLLDSDSCNARTADRIFHALLLLGTHCRSSHATAG